VSWFKIAKRKSKEKSKNYNKIDYNLICCQFPENRRKDPYKKKKGKNYPPQP